METEGEELDGDEIVLLLNGFKFGLRMGKGLVVVVLGPAVGKPTPAAVLFVKNGPWLMIELEGEEEFNDNFRWRGELVGDGDDVVLGLLTLMTLSLRNRAKGSRGDEPMVVGLEGRMNRSAIVSL